ncbi:class I adenylate-forming enzyme family protein [Pseudonocardia sp. DLS-67]
MSPHPMTPAPDPVPLAGGNLAGIARWAAGTYGDAPALELENGERFTFVELARRVAGLAAELAERGVGANDRIAVALDNRSTFPLAILAAAHLGAAVLPLNPGYKDAELAAVLDLVEPTHVVALASFCDRHDGLLKSSSARVVPVDGPVSWADAPLQVRDLPYEDLGRAGHLDDRVRFGLTSGSTGVPKAVTKTHRQWLMDGRAIRTVMAMTRHDRVLSSQPLYYGDPFIVLMGCLQAGATCVYLTRFRSSTFMQNVANRRITKFMTIGAMPAMLLNTPRAEHDRAHHAVAAWSVAVPRALHAELERRFGVPWLEAYGTSECGVVLAQTAADEREVGAGWLGRPAPGQEVRLVGDDGSEVSGDGPGMLDVRGPTVCAEYWRRPDASREVFLPGGWYRTGDVMERRDGRYRYLYRRKDIVRRAGENISCQEVEAALRRHPDVVDAAVVARPDPVRGEEVWAFVQLEAGVPEGDEVRERAESVVATAESALARHKVPRYVSFVPEFPRTPSERVAKRHLAELGAPTVDLGARRRPAAADSLR